MDIDTGHRMQPEAGPSRLRSPPSLPPRHESIPITDGQTKIGSEAGEEGMARTSTDVSSDQMLVDAKGDELYYRTYRGEEEDLAGVKRLIDQELSEPYTVYTFRYFLNEWPHLTFLVFPSQKATEPIATIMCKQESHRGKTNRGYIGMLSVDKAWRRRGIASKLVELAIAEMGACGAHEIVLETEFDNKGSLALYDSIGFLREKRVHGFYSNLKDAFRLILKLPTPIYEPPIRSDAVKEPDPPHNRMPESTPEPGPLLDHLDRSHDPFPSDLDMYT